MLIFKEASMGHCMVEKLGHYCDLSEDEKNLVLSLEEKEEDYTYGEVIRKQGSSADELYIIKNGWAIISSSIDNDVRSIFNIKLPGDVVGISEISFPKYLYDFTALTNVTVCPFPKENLDDIFKKSDKLNRVFYSILSREQSILYERIISLGRRTALEKVAHLIIEVAVRLGGLGHSMEGKIPFPVRQEHVADILGLSAIHVNRSMNELKRHGYIEYDRNSITLKDKDRLFNLADFNPLFLQKPDTRWHYKDKESKAA